MKKKQDAHNKSHSQIISDVFKTAMNENMLTRLTHPAHRQASNLWNQLSHKIDLSYPPKSSLIPINNNHAQKQDLSISIEDIRYSMRHSFCAYQPALIAMKSQELSLGIKSHDNVLKACFGISDDDIIVNKCTSNPWKSTVHEPSFYLIVDHNKRKIVLSIRGTSSISDIMTDLNAKCKKCDNDDIGFHTGYVHEGMLHSAKFIKDKINFKLCGLCKIYSNYQVIICGHSLGAGIASLLGLMYANDPIIRYKNRLKVYSFASPCIVSKEFDEQKVGYSYIHSIALSTDIITRLSFESIKKWNLRQDLIMNYPQDKIIECLLDTQEQQSMEGQECESSTSEFLRVLKSLESPDPNLELFPLGRVLWLVPNIVMDDDIVLRRKCLMDFVKIKAMDIDKDKEEEEKKEPESKWKNLFGSISENIANKMQGLQANANEIDTYNHRQDSSVNDVFKEFVKDLNKGMHDIKTEIRSKMDMTTNTAKYNGNNYILCDASSCKYVFQDLVLDFPECFHAHGPERYLWAFDATLRPNQ